MLYILPALVLAACERVTAPKALEIADKLEENLRDRWVPGTIMSIFDGAPLNAWFNLRDRSTIVAAKDGPMEEVRALVVERVFIPPSGYGAPLSRRSLVAFPENAVFGILAVTETEARERSGINGFDKLVYSDLNPQASLAVASPSKEDWWTPRSGRVVIEPLETGARCPLGMDGGDVEADRRGSVSCNLASYDVQLEGEFVRQRDAANSLLPESMKRRHHLNVPPQHVNGIRFTIRCPSKDLASMLGSTWYGLECTNAFHFWRSNDLFARSLGVDVTQMEPARRGSSTYVRTLRAGIDKYPPDNIGLLRYTLSDPDGSIVARDTLSLSAQHLSFAYDTWLSDDCTRGLKYLERRQCLVSLGFYPKGRSKLLVGVVDLESIAK